MLSICQTKIRVVGIRPARSRGSARWQDLSDGRTSIECVVPSDMALEAGRVLLATAAAFQIDNLTLSGADRPRLDRVSLRIESGVTAIVGYSGAGKTSLLNVLAGFEQPESGTVQSVAAENTNGRLPLFWAPQNGGLWSHLTAREHLAAVRPPDISGEFMISSDEILQQLDLHHRSDAVPVELSQGERSRLAIARAMASRAHVLLLDEPLAHVDSARRDGYWRLLRTLFYQLQTTVVFASHEPEAVVRESANVICMNEGKVIYHGSTRKLYDDPPNQLAGEFLGRLNWFSREDLPIWIDKSGSCIETSDSHHGVGIRPERVSISVRHDGQLEVVESWFAGARCETTVRNRRTGNLRTIVHRSGEADLVSGQVVEIRVAG